MATRTPACHIMKATLRHALRRHLGIPSPIVHGLVGGVTFEDKAYELHALIRVLTTLSAKNPGIALSLSSGTALKFREKGGPVDRKKWSYIEVHDAGQHIAEIWLDIEFSALSAMRHAWQDTAPSYGDYHELDIVVVRPNCSPRPTEGEVILAVEAKHRRYNKALLKEIIGISHELQCRGRRGKPSNWLHGSLNANNWTDKKIPCLATFCSSRNIEDYAESGHYWGVVMLHAPLRKQTMLMTANSPIR